MYQIIESVLGKNSPLEQFAKNEESKGMFMYLVVKKALDMKMQLPQLVKYQGDSSYEAMSYCYDNDLALPLQKSDKINELKKRLTKLIDMCHAKNLEKGNDDMSVRPPQPPKAGTNVGGSNGISKKGFHEPKTIHTDMPGHKPKTEVGQITQSSQAKAMFKVPKPAKLAQAEVLRLSLGKTEYEKSSCEDCGNLFKTCKCFSSLSKPEVTIIKNEVKMTFKNDWDKDLVKALFKSIKRGKNV